jgi:hypothetical protein
VQLGKEIERTAYSTETPLPIVLVVGLESVTVVTTVNLLAMAVEPFVRNTERGIAEAY